MQAEKCMTPELKKHVNTIHCSNNLSLVQRKLYNALLYNAYHRLLDQSCFDIPIKRLCELIGYNSHDYNGLKKALLGLMSITIEWNVISTVAKDSNKWAASTILASVTLQKGICSYEYSSILREFLYRPEIYGRINIETQSKFKSNYGLALYENCIRYAGIPQTPWFPLTIFRKLMGVVDGKYINFKDFKKRVINIAVKEVSEYASLNVLPEIRKEYDKTISIRFKLSQNKELDKALEEKDNDLYNILLNTFKYSPGAIKKIYLSYDLSYVKEKVDVIIESNSFKNGKITGLQGYLMAALKENYQTPVNSAQIAHKKNKQMEEVNEKEKAKEDQINAVRPEYIKYATSVLKKTFPALKESKQNKLIEQFKGYLQLRHLSVIEYHLVNYGFFDPSVVEFFVPYLIKNHKEVSNNLMSIEQFYETMENTSDLLSAGTFTG